MLHDVCRGLEGLLKSMHKGTKHVGKVRSHCNSTRITLKSSAELQQQLDKAVADEDFEQAAVLRDEIKQAREKFDRPDHE